MGIRQGFKNWLHQAWVQHPFYTIMFGAGCALVGGIIF